MSRVEVVVGLDVGTTSAKAVAVEASGAQHGGGECAYDLHAPNRGWATQDPGDVVRGALTAVRKSAAVAESGGARVIGLSVSSAMHGLVALDSEGVPLGELLTWADARATEQARELRKRRPDLHERTGTPIHPMAPVAKLLWLAEHEPELFRRAERWVGQKELVLHALTGRWVVDQSVASGTGLQALDTLTWDAEALAVAGVAEEQLAELVATADVVGELAPDAARSVGLATGLPVVAGAGDGPLANLGVGAVQPGVAACSIGTSGALRLVVDSAAVDPARRMFCYALTPGRWVVGGAINNGGSALEWTGRALGAELGEDRAETLLAEAAAVPPGADGLLMLPHLLSERAPHWNHEAAGAYLGLSHTHTRGHLVRAALEGVCRQLALVLESMRDAGHEVSRVRATGGFARSELWKQMLADTLDLAIDFPAGREGSAFGAALLGLLAVGHIDTIDQAAELVELDERVEPDPATAGVYERLKPIADGAYEALAPALRRLREEAGAQRS